jgi:hypothetical protein
VSLRCGLGVPLLLLSLLGLLPAGRRRTPGDWILFAFFAVYFGVAGLSTVRFARYMIPIVPVLCLWAARLLVTNDFKCSGTLAYRGLGLACVLLTAAYTVTLVMSMAARDPRDVAADRLLATAPAEASIAFATVPWYYSPPLSPYFGLLAAPDRARAAADSSRFRLLVPRSEWDVSVLTPLPDYVVLSSLETMNAVERLRLPAPVRFVRDIPVEYIRIVVRPARVFDASAVLPGAMVPEDMLYTRPSITIYANPASVEEAPPQRSATP